MAISTDPSVLFSGIEVACFGSRKTPSDVLHLMMWIGRAIVASGGVIRTGHAEGADRAFELALYEPGDAGLPGRWEDGTLRVYLPWSSYNSHLDLPSSADVLSLDDRVECPQHILIGLEEIAARHHPYWDNCGQGARKLHMRNILIGSGASAGICYLGDGPLGGGSGQCWRFLGEMGVPRFDLRDEETRRDVTEELRRRGFWHW